MKLTRIMQDTVLLMEGGRVERTRRPGEYFDLPTVTQPTFQLKMLPLLLIVALYLFG